jgi:hypothetical protein
MKLFEVARTRLTMKRHRRIGSSSDTGSENSTPSKAGIQTTPRRHRRWRKFATILIAIAVVLGIGRAFLPSIVRDYVNRTLDRNLLYEGRVGDVEIHLWRGAYSIHDIKISKRTGHVPVPFFAAKRLDFSIEWDALLHRRMVGRFLMDEPELNFVSNPAEQESQTGAGSPWLQMIRDLFPFNINSAVIQNGSVHFRTYQSQRPVDIYLSHVNGSIDDLSNIRDQTNPLVTAVRATGLAMDQARLELKMTLDPFSYRPTFHVAVRLLGLDVTKLNDFALTFGKIDFKRGWLDLVIEADAKEGQLTGYVKPLFRNLKIFSLSADLSEDTVLQFFWQALVGGTTTLFKNFARDQFGTLIPFTGDMSKTTTADILATIGNILRNAFVRAYLPHLEIDQAIVGDFQFEPPDFTEALSTANETQ